MDNVCAAKIRDGTRPMMKLRDRPPSLKAANCLLVENTLASVTDTHMLAQRFRDFLMVLRCVARHAFRAKPSHGEAEESRHVLALWPTWRASRLWAGGRCRRCSERATWRPCRALDSSRSHLAVFTVRTSATTTLGPDHTHFRIPKAAPRNGGLTASP